MIHDIKARATRVTLALIIFLDMLGFTLIIPILAPLLLDSTQLLPYTTSASTRAMLLGVLLSLYAIAQFIGAPMLGALSDRFGRKRLLVCSLFGSFLGYLALGFGIAYSHLWLIFLGRVVAGFTGGNISIALSAMADVSDEKAKAKNFGLIGMAFGLGFIIGPFIGGKLADPMLVPWFDFATPLWFAAGLALMTVALCAILLPETCTIRRKTPVSALTGIRNIFKAFKLPDLRIMFIVIFLLAFGFNFVTQFFQVFLIQKFQYTQSQIGDIFAYAGLWIAVSQVALTTPLSHRFKPHQVLPFFILLSAIAIGLLVLPDKAWMIWIIMPFVLIGQGVTQPNATAVISNLSGEDSQGEIMGINQSIQSLGMAVPPLIAGMLVTLHRNLPIIIGAILTLAAGVVFVLFYRGHREALFHEV
jgi:DHA1 family tetracycline resistance protein-like MFS transporter